MGTDDSPHVCTQFSPAPASIPSSPGSHSNSTQIIPKNGVCPYFFREAELARRYDIDIKLELFDSDRLISCRSRSVAELTIFVEAPGPH